MVQNSNLIDCRIEFQGMSGTRGHGDVQEQYISFKMLKSVSYRGGKCLSHDAGFLSVEKQNQCSDCLSSNCLWLFGEEKMLALVSWTTSILEDYIWPECGLNSALRAQTPGSQPATLGGFFFFFYLPPFFNLN